MLCQCLNKEISRLLKRSECCSLLRKLSFPDKVQQSVLDTRIDFAIFICTPWVIFYFPSTLILNTHTFGFQAVHRDKSEKGHQGWRSHIKAKGWGRSSQKKKTVNPCVSSLVKEFMDFEWDFQKVSYRRDMFWNYYFGYIKSLCQQLFYSH